MDSSDFVLVTWSLARMRDTMNNLKRGVDKDNFLFENLTIANSPIIAATIFARTSNILAIWSPKKSKIDSPAVGVWV